MDKPGAIAYFDDIADRYDSSSSRDGWSVHQHLARVLAELEVPPRRVLDLGGGTGRTSEVVLQQFPSAAVDLVDASAAMVARARVLLASSRVRVHVADLREFRPAGAEAYDLIVAMGVLEFTPDLTGTLAHVAGLLAVGGRFVFTYEPIVHGSGPQGDAETTVDLATGPLTVTRHHPGAVNAAVGAAGLRNVTSELFVSYLRGGTEPVIYALLVTGADG